LDQRSITSDVVHDELVMIIEIEYTSKLLDVGQLPDDVLLNPLVENWLNQNADIWHWEWVWHRSDQPMRYGPGHGELTVPDQLVTFFTLTWL
jgi:hypothetical protein